MIGTGTDGHEAGSVVTLPTRFAWWRASVAEMQEQEAAARRRTRELSLQLAAVTVELRRAEAKLAVSRRALHDSTERERVLRRRIGDERRVAAGRDRRLAAIEASRGYRFLRFTWRLRGALRHPVRALRRNP